MRLSFPGRLLPGLFLAIAGALAACSSGPATSASSNGGGTSRAIPASGPAAAPATAVTVPLKVIRHGPATMELIPVYVAGHGPYTFMLDTGSSVSSVSRQLAAKLGLRRTGTTTQIRGVVTTSRVPMVAIAGWKLGSVALTPEKVAVLDLSKTGGGSLAGLLGSDELRHFGAVTVDFTHEQLRLAHR